MIKNTNTKRVSLPEEILERTLRNRYSEYPTNKTIIELFEEQVEHTPNHVAITFNEVSMTYRELNNRANHLATKLIAQGVKTNQFVGIIFTRSPELVISALAIMKSGAAYLPIDPTLPLDRIIYMLEDCDIDLVVAEDLLMKRIPFQGTIISAECEEQLENYIQNPSVMRSPNDFIYVMYTSGTTGIPKGVPTQHKNVVSLMKNEDFPYDITANDVWTLFHSPCFDFSVWEMYGALLNGGRLVIIPKFATIDVKAYLDILEKEKVTILNQTPFEFNNVAKAEQHLGNKLSSLRYVIFSGESLKSGMLLPWKEKYPNTMLINTYGITETTIDVAYKEITEKEINNNLRSIGKPYPTVSVLIMDENMEIVPIGVSGEIYVGGLGVTKGYLNRPELTQEKFIKNPYKPEETLYKSGDLAKYLPNGEIEYLGRIDKQIKIKGYRIEIEDIESNMLKYPLIEDVVVISRKDPNGKPYLVAYIVEQNKAINLNELKDFLLDLLPRYMIPAVFIPIKTIPLTKNGKVDEAALPDANVNIN